VSRLVHETAARKPDVLSVNEVCRAQYDRLRHDLGAAGYVMHGAYAQMQRNVAACGDDTSFGTAVFSRQPLTGTPDYRRYSDTGGETYEGAGRTETVRRGLLCVDTTLADGDPLTACTSHAGTAFEQLDEVHRWFADPEKFPEDRPVVFAGDLNQQPNERSLSGIYAHTRGENDRRDPDGRFIEAAETDRKWFRLGASGGVRCDDPEAERCRNGPPTAADGRKIDYVFATESHFTDPHGSLSTYPESDHALYEGTFRLR
jgi:endonuclease/exonuclease/phosphatase family metal-dependent hydrolase